MEKTTYMVPVQATLHVKREDGEEWAADKSDLAKFNLVKGNETYILIQSAFTQAARDLELKNMPDVFKLYNDLLVFMLTENPQFSTYSDDTNKAKLTELASALVQEFKVIEEDY